MPRSPRLATALGAAPGTVALDVRAPAEFAAGHLERARELDFRSAGFDARLAALDKGTVYALSCHSGNRSDQALERMKAAGFTHVADLRGRITAWTGDGRSVATG